MCKLGRAYYSCGHEDVGIANDVRKMIYCSEFRKRNDQPCSNPPCK